MPPVSMSCPGLARLVRVHLPFSHWSVRSVRRCFVGPPKLLCPAHAMRDAKPIQGRAQCHRALGRESAEAVGCNRGAAAAGAPGMVLQIYGVPLSQPCRAVVWACMYKELPFELILTCVRAG